MPEVKPELKAKQPNKPVDWAAIEQSLTPAFLGNVSEIILPFDLHIPEISGKTGSIKQSMKRRNASIY